MAGGDGGDGGEIDSAKEPGQSFSTLLSRLSPDPYPSSEDCMTPSGGDSVVVVLVMVRRCMCVRVCVCGGRVYVCD